MSEELRIQIDQHTLERALERGTNEVEIHDVLQTGLPIAAKQGRQGRTKIFEFRKIRNGKYYEQKRVNVFYTMGGRTLVTVTVYVFYGTWGS